MKGKKIELYDVSAELEKEFGEPGSPERRQAEQEAWEDYNAQILMDARKSARLTQEQLAERVGVDKGYISRVERGLIVPTIGTFYKIVAAMGLSVELRPHA
jgi:ribosome-binding protein aMBF1 (putative translation factor)